MSWEIRDGFFLRMFSPSVVHSDCFNKHRWALTIRHGARSEEFKDREYSLCGQEAHSRGFRQWEYRVLCALLQARMRFMVQSSPQIFESRGGIQFLHLDNFSRVQSNLNLFFWNKAGCKCSFTKVFDKDPFLHTERPQDELAAIRVYECFSQEFLEALRGYSFSCISRGRIMW